MKKQPFQETALNPDQLQANMRQARAEAEQAVTEDSTHDDAEGAAKADEKKASRAMSQS
jgi:magnesium chelatase subunit I